MFQISMFLSTLSLRRATVTAVKITPKPSGFYPRSPCGERLFSSVLFAFTHMFLSTLSLRRATGGFHKINCQMMVFLSTLSLRRATQQTLRLLQGSAVSIHALLAESDLPPHQEKGRNRVSIHALLAESDAAGVFPVILII